MTPKSKSQRPRGSADDPFDLVVVGGGINGAGIARDAARRGMSVALFEKRDYGTGATGASSGMIHGGLRYLRQDPAVTQLACLDSGYIQKICSHLIFRIPFIFPVLGTGFARATLLELAEVYFETYDRYQPLKRGKGHCRLSKDELQQIVPGITPRARGAVTTDEWGIEANRLNLINALDAIEAGAELNTYNEVVGLLKEGGKIHGVRVRDLLAGGTREVFGKVVLNASGAWATHTTRMLGSHMTRHVVRPGKGVHVVYPGRLTNYAIIVTAIDGREIFISPNQNETWIGTTDDDYWGDLDEIPVLEDEIRYLVESVAHVLPSVRNHRIMRTMVGCRPTMYAYGKPESDLSREHELLDHSDDGAAGFYSITGGKLASYRVISEEVTDTFAERLGGRFSACDTHTAYLPGGTPHDIAPAQFAELGIDGYTAGRILYRHGSQADRVLDLMKREPRTRAIVCPCEPVTEAELRVVIRREAVRTLDDCRRRCKLGSGPCGGAQCTLRAAQIFSDERALIHNTSLDNVLSMVGEFRQQNTRTPIVLMGYLNPVEMMGYQQFADKAAAVGLDGVLVVDMPPEEAEEFGDIMKASSIDVIFLVSPTTDSERIKLIAEKASGYLYYVSLKGVTGANTLDIDSVAGKLNEMRAITDLPIGVGFGIKDGHTAQAVSAIADAVVVGSALVKQIEQAPDQPQAIKNGITNILSEMRMMMDANNRSVA